MSRGKVNLTLLALALGLSPAIVKGAEISLVPVRASRHHTIAGNSNHVGRGWTDRLAGGSPLRIDHVPVTVASSENQHQAPN